MTRRNRKPLSEQLGPIHVTGASDHRGLLREAFEATRLPTDTLTHGFHSYPARMHYAMARTLLNPLVGPGARVLDPFCGAGTVPLEAMLAGCDAHGSDINPLALQLAAVKSQVRREKERQRFLAVLKDVAEASERRVRERVPIRAKLPKAELQWYAPHTLLELAGLLHEIQHVPDAPDREALTMLFSAIVVKFALQRSDTQQAPQKKRIRKGLPTEFFFRKGEELLRRWKALYQALENPDDATIHFQNRDARRLPRSLAPVHLVLTSPPYPGIYDYAEHHARRLAWLGIRGDTMSKREIGARRHQWNRDAERRFSQALRDVLESCARVLHRQGHVLLLIGDGRLGRQTIEAPPLLHAVTPETGLSVLASATAVRPERGPIGRTHEHLFLLTHAHSARQRRGRKVAPDTGTSQR